MQNAAAGIFQTRFSYQICDNHQRFVSTIRVGRPKPHDRLMMNVVDVTARESDVKVNTVSQLMKSETDTREIARSQFTAEFVHSDPFAEHNFPLEVFIRVDGRHQLLVPRRSSYFLQPYKLIIVTNPKRSSC